MALHEPVAAPHSTGKYMTMAHRYRTDFNRTMAAANTTGLNDGGNTTTATPGDVLLSHCEGPFPTSDEYFPRLHSAELIFIGVCGCITVGLILSFLTKIWYIVKYYQTNKLIIYKSIGILGIFPLVSLTAFLCLCFPRASIVCSFVQSIYIARSLFGFVSMMMAYLNGPTNLRARLKDQVIPLRAPPLCCCCFCLPNLKVNRKSIMFLRILTLQYAIVAPINACLSLILLIDGRYEIGKMAANDAYPYLSTLNTVSALFAMYSYIMFYRLCKESLRVIQIVAKFVSLQLVIIFVTLQNSIFGLLTKFNIPACERGLSSALRGQVYHNMLLVFEMLILSMVARRAYIRPHTNLDDLEQSIKRSDANDERPADVDDEVPEKAGPESIKGNGFCLPEAERLKEENVLTEGGRLLEKESTDSKRDSYIAIDPIGKMSLPYSQESDV